jgi:type II secretory pathway component HofQ
MASLMRLLVIAVSVPSFYATSAQATILADSTQHRPRMHRRALRHNQPPIRFAHRARSRRLAEYANRAVAKTDARPVQILIETTLVQVVLNKDHQNAADSGLQITWDNRKDIDFLRSIESLGETKVLAAPRLLILNKQNAEVFLGAYLYYVTKTSDEKQTIQKVNHVPIGTQLQVTPFVTANGMIRLDICVGRSTSTGHLDSNGIPQTDTVQISTALIMPDGATAVIKGPTYDKVTQDREPLPCLKWLPCSTLLFPTPEPVAKKTQLLLRVTTKIILE